MSIYCEGGTKLDIYFYIRIIWLYFYIRGIHRTSEVIHMLLPGKIEYNTEPQINSMLPFQTPERMDQLPSPRIINSHMYFRHLPRDILKKRNTIVFVNRNPKDVAVSYYYHCQQVSLKFQGSWNDFLDFFLLDQGKKIKG